MKKLIPLIILLIGIPTVLAQPKIGMNLDIKQEKLGPGDQLLAELKLKNNFESSQNITIETSFKKIDGSSVDILSPVQQKLESNEEKILTIYNRTISNSFKRGTYHLDLRIILENGSIITKSKDLQVVNTLKDFNFKLQVCRDISCNKKAKTFEKNNKIFLNFSSSIEPQIKANIVYPEGKKEQISIPTVITKDKVGTYTIKATASKGGYKTISSSTQFAVINKSADIKSDKPEIPGLQSQVCKKKTCEDKVESVKNNKTVWLDYSSDLESVSSTAKLTYPDGTSEEVELPKEISPDQAGEYELEVTASKQGYQETSNSYTFSVEEDKKKPDDGGGTEENTSQLLKYAPYLIFGIAIIVSIIIFLSLVPKNK